MYTAEALISRSKNAPMYSNQEAFCCLSVSISFTDYLSKRTWSGVNLSSWAEKLTYLLLWSLEEKTISDEAVLVSLIQGDVMLAVAVFVTLPWRPSNYQDVNTNQEPFMFIYIPR